MTSDAVTGRRVPSRKARDDRGVTPAPGAHLGSAGAPASGLATDQRDHVALAEARSMDGAVRRRAQEQRVVLARRHHLEALVSARRGVVMRPADHDSSIASRGHRSARRLEGLRREGEVLPGRHRLPDGRNAVGHHHGDASGRIEDHVAHQDVGALLIQARRRLLTDRVKDGAADGDGRRMRVGFPSSQAERGERRRRQRERLAPERHLEPARRVGVGIRLATVRLEPPVKTAPRALERGDERLPSEHGGPRRFRHHAKPVGLAQRSELRADHTHPRRPFLGPDRRQRHRAETAIVWQHAAAHRGEHHVLEDRLQVFHGRPVQQRAGRVRDDNLETKARFEHDRSTPAVGRPAGPRARRRDGV